MSEAAHDFESELIQVKRDHMADVRLLNARLVKADRIAEALRAFVEPEPHTDGYGEIDRGAAALAEWDALA